MQESKKAVMSYSGGKDSAYALYLAKEEGYEAIALVTTMVSEGARSWFHGIPEGLLKEVASSMEIPFYPIHTTLTNYEKAFEEALTLQKERGATHCIFGDIDILAHRDWCEARCKNTGLEAVFPLWQMDRKKVVEGYLKAGFLAVITVIDGKILPDYLIGMPLTQKIMRMMEALGADPAGENGEYHTFTYDGPLFKRPIAFEEKDALSLDHYKVLPLSVVDKIIPFPKKK